LIGTGTMTDTLERFDDAPPTTSKDRGTVIEAGDQAGLRGNTVIGRTATINRPRNELFAFWRDFANLPQFMQEIETVEVITVERSRWTSGGDGWDVIVTDEQDGAFIAWESATGAEMQISGRVDFRDATGGRGTEVILTTAYTAKGGAMGRMIATLLQREPGLQARRDLRRFKQLMETGEVTTSSWTNAQAKAEKE